MATKNQVNTWDERLAKSAQVAAKAENKNIERPYFSFSGGKMSLRGAAIPNNEAPVIVLEDVQANLYYPGKYDPNNPAPPECYAFGRVDEDGNLVGIDTFDGKPHMAPHKDVPAEARQHTMCEGCPMNEWGSGSGQGKACQNTRRLAMIPAGTMVDGRFKAFDKPEQVEDAQIVFAKIPTMSCKGFASYVVGVADNFARPLWAMFSRMSREADERSQFRVVFEALGAIPNALLDAVFAKRELAVKEIGHPFQPPKEDDGKKKKPATTRRRYT